MATLDLEKGKEKGEKKKRWRREKWKKWSRQGAGLCKSRAQLQLERGELTGESSLGERERGYGVAQGI